MDNPPQPNPVPPRHRLFGMPKWLWFCVLAMLFWGGWGFVSKVASDLISPLLLQVLQTLGLVPLVLAVVFSRNFREGTDKFRGAGYGFLTGLFGGLGLLAFFQALSRGGEASQVVPMTGVFPLVTVLLALLLLKERLNRVQMVGIGLATLAFILLSGS